MNKKVWIQKNFEIKFGICNLLQIKNRIGFSNNMGLKFKNSNAISMDVKKKISTMSFR